MFPVSQPARRRHRGFTMIELMIVVVIIGIMAAVGFPSMMRMLNQTKANTAMEFYHEGLMAARRQALSHNSFSRFRLIDGATTGAQPDWQVDICYIVPGSPCTDTAGAWSTVDAVATGEPDTVAPYKSVLKSAASLPKTDRLALTVRTVDATAVYFTPMGWVNPAIPNRLNQMRFDHPSLNNDVIRPVAVAVSLAGISIRCDPSIAQTVVDSRRCPP